MNWYKADIHLHSCLSPCGSLESSPKALAKAAKNLGLDLIALSDHNSALNCPAFKSACEALGIKALFGSEVTCAEEAHCLCLFETPEQALEFGAFVYKNLIPIPHKPEKWGDQVWVNDDEEIEGNVELFLVSPTSLELDRLEKEVHRRGGLFIPAHVDRLAMSLTSQLGFVPPGNYDALEIIRPDTNLESLGLDSELSYPLICDSDAHHPGYLGQRHFRFQAETCDFSGLKEALRLHRVERVFDIP